MLFDLLCDQETKVHAFGFGAAGMGDQDLHVFVSAWCEQNHGSSRESWNSVHTVFNVFSSNMSNLANSDKHIIRLGRVGCVFSVPRGTTQLHESSQQPPVAASHDAHLHALFDHKCRTNSREWCDASTADCFQQPIVKLLSLIYREKIQFPSVLPLQFRIENIMLLKNICVPPEATVVGKGVDLVLSYHLCRRDFLPFILRVGFMTKVVLDDDQKQFIFSIDQECLGFRRSHTLPQESLIGHGEMES
mmetsp:Transcript_31875/g.66516  ORF Transcript_31875/g.66516 Transcript_31875/m.66516 type:complete len:247 (-) Transcript_31875:62-802(-)